MDLELESREPLADEMPAHAPSAAARAAEAKPLESLLAAAERHGATHLHVEPGGVARLRVAGRLVRATQLAPDEAHALFRCLAAGPVEHRGRTLSASIHSVREGARVVLALGTTPAASGALAALGMAPSLAHSLAATLDRGGGLVLVAGPAGSGRSTTLVALLRTLDPATGNLMTLEAGEDLRALLQQDPDAVLIDSLEDRATAALAVEAASSGRLVLAGVAASHAVSTIRTLRALRVEPFQLATALRAVVAQRLVRRLCRSCRQPVQARGSTSALLGFDPGAIVYEPVGCDACGGTGYAGETGVFEVVRFDAALRRLVNDGGDEAIIARHAFVNAPNLGSAARALVREGVTTPEEAVRVSRG